MQSAFYKHFFRFGTNASAEKFQLLNFQNALSFMRRFYLLHAARTETTDKIKNELGIN